MEIINLTPHAVTVVDTTYPVSGKVVRLEFSSEVVYTINGLEVEKNHLVGHNLPEPVEGIFLLVSAMVLGQFPERNDLLAPNTNKAIRNEKGHILSVPGFVC